MGPARPGAQQPDGPDRGHRLDGDLDDDRVAGMGKWIMGGGVADASMIDSAVPAFPEVAGFMIHGINGIFVVPIIALVLIVLSFFTRHRRAVVIAVALFVGVVLQGQLGSWATRSPPLARCTA